jgi:hypothetical protein
LDSYRDHAISFGVEKPEDLLEFIDLIFSETHFEFVRSGKNMNFYFKQRNFELVENCKWMTSSDEKNTFAL